LLDCDCGRRHDLLDEQRCELLAERDELLAERAELFAERTERLDERGALLADRAELLLLNDGPCPPTAISSSSSLNSMAPAGFSGSDACSSSLRLSLYSGSFHARITRSNNIVLLPFAVIC
jgi:hypothetical protein